MKVRDVLKRLADDGWYEARMRGSHRVLKHPTKQGIVVVAGHPGKDLAPGTLKASGSRRSWRSSLEHAYQKIYRDLRRDGRELFGLRA